MRAAKCLTIITIVLTIIFLVLSVLFYFYKINLAYDISLAIFGGSILGFIMSLIENTMLLSVNLWRHSIKRH